MSFKRTYRQHSKERLWKTPFNAPEGSTCLAYSSTECNEIGIVKPCSLQCCRSNEQSASNDNYDFCVVLLAHSLRSLWTTVNLFHVAAAGWRSNSSWTPSEDSSSEPTHACAACIPSTNASRCNMRELLRLLSTQLRSAVPALVQSYLLLVDLGRASGWWEDSERHWMVPVVNIRQGELLSATCRQKSVGSSAGFRTESLVLAWCGERERVPERIECSDQRDIGRAT